MSIYLSNLKRIVGNKRVSKRIGRGVGSGKGWHTSSKGSKGQKARTGGKTNIWFEGGQTPIVRRMPYIRGFVNHNAKDVYSINLSRIISISGSSKKITPNVLVVSGMFKELPRFVKIMGTGSIDQKIEFEGFIYTKRAKEKIEKAGGKIN